MKERLWQNCTTSSTSSNRKYRFRIGVMLTKARRSEMQLMDVSGQLNYWTGSRYKFCLPTIIWGNRGRTTTEQRSEDRGSLRKHWFKEKTCWIRWNENHRSILCWAREVSLYEQGSEQAIELENCYTAKVEPLSIIGYFNCGDPTHMLNDY